jgi:L-alanine-DL-glutamate epimerase-like enolase superfamily enzyme
MRLRHHSLHCYRLRYERPVRWSDIVEEAAPFVLLRLESDTGAIGVAEITVKPTWCGVTARSLITAIEEIFVPVIAGIDLDDPTTVRAALDRVPENQPAKTLIDNACWDLHAAHEGTALWRQWKGTRRVELSWALTRQAPPLMAREAADMVARYGFRTLKVKGGQGIDIDLAGLREIKSAVGDQIRLYVDANGAYPAQQAPDYIKAIAAAGAETAEDPCPFSPSGWFHRLQQESPVPLLVDFGCTSVRDAALFIEQGAQALSIKPGRFGLSDSRAMQRFAVQAGCVPVVGLMGESALGTLAGLQFASTVANPVLPAELTWFLAMIEQVIEWTPPIIDGHIALPECRSLAELVDWKAVERYRFRNIFQNSTMPLSTAAAGLWRWPSGRSGRSPRRPIATLPRC